MWRRPPTAAEAPKVDARRLTDSDWNALCHVSCSVLSGGGRVRGVAEVGVHEQRVECPVESERSRDAAGIATASACRWWYAGQNDTILRAIIGSPNFLGNGAAARGS